MLCRDYSDDYLGQQVTKLFADTYSNADYIAHIDSDCVFCRPTTPQDLIPEGKPVVLMHPLALLDPHLPWQKPTEKFLSMRVCDDFMRHPPFTFPRWLYKKVREHAQAIHGIDIETYITMQPPRGFSEFNVLAAFAWHRCHGDFVWVDTSKSIAGEPHCRWYWSWGGMDAAIRREIRAIVG